MYQISPSNWMMVFYFTIFMMMNFFMMMKNLYMSYFKKNKMMIKIYVK